MLPGGELSVTKGALQAGDEFAAKNSAQHFHGEEKAYRRRTQCLPSSERPTAWDHTVDMRVMQKILAPGMKAHSGSRSGRRDACVRRDLQQSGGTGADKRP